MSRATFTTSWDDGHPLDLRAAELLAKHGCGGTFYVPSAIEPSMSTGELRTLAQGFEIGAHTLDHRRLPELSETEKRHQILHGKSELEDRLGVAVQGFAYPGGRHDPVSRAIVREAGFTYARTVESFALSLRRDLFLMPTTLQIYPHSGLAHLKNFLKRGNWQRRLPAFRLALATPDLMSLLARLLDLVHESGGLLHVWGHSLDIETFGLWSGLDEFLSLVAECVPRQNRIDNLSVSRRISL
jgi:hypothetical protein